MTAVTGGKAAVAQKLSVTSRDELTAVPKVSEASGPIQRLARSQANGAAVIYVSSGMDDRRHIAGWVLVLRSGRNAGTSSSDDVTSTVIATVMLRWTLARPETASPEAGTRGRSLADRGSFSEAWTPTIPILAAIALLLPVFGVLHAAFTTVSSEENAVTVTEMLGILVLALAHTTVSDFVPERAEEDHFLLKVGVLRALHGVQAGT